MKKISIIVGILAGIFAIIGVIYTIVNPSTSGNNVIVEGSFKDNTNSSISVDIQ